MFPKRVVLLITLLQYGLFCFTQEKNGFQSTLTIENDFLGINNKDDNYTGGASIDVVMPGLRLKQPFYSFKTGTDFQLLSIGGTAYTPQDLESSQIVIGDRPYASLTYLKLGKLSISENLDKQIISELLVGFSGWQGPGEAQSYVHRNGWFGSTRPIPRGWSNQIGYNGSFVFNYNIKWLQSIFSEHENEQDLEIMKPYWNYGADIGTYMTNLKFGFFVNAINFNSYPILGSADARIPTKKLLKKNKINEDRLSPLRFHIYIEPTFRIIGYDSTLQGLLWGNNSAYTINSTDIQRLVFDFRSGIKILLFNSIHLGYHFNLRTKEFKEGKKIHYWGGILIGFSPRKWVNKHK